MLIEKLILHWVGKSSSAKTLVKSEKLAVEFDHNFWKSKIESAFDKKRCYEVAFKNDTPSTVGMFIRGLKSAVGDEKFIKVSHDLADFLYTEQNKKNTSNGFLVILKGKTDEEKEYLCLLKLEGLEGSEAIFNNSRKSYDLKQLQSILLTKKTKVFKMAFFIMNGLHFLKMYVMDDQNKKEEIADFWLKSFLGCDFIETPENLTKKLFDFVSDFSNSNRLTVDEKLNLKIGLNAEMNSKTKTLKLSTISKKYIPDDLLEHFNSKSKKENIPLHEFEKKFSPSIQKRISIRQFYLEENIFVKMPQILIDEERLVKYDKANKVLSLSAKVIKEI